MREQLWLHTVAQLRFYRRNRLLLGLLLLIGVVMLLPMVPSLIDNTPNDRFRLLQSMSSQFGWLVWWGAGALGLFAVSAHLRDRSVKLIFTRPGRPEIWVLSIFLSAFLVALAGETIASVMTLVLSLAWGVPYQIGFLYLSINALAQTMILVALLTTLATRIHPVIAVLAVAFFNEQTLYWIEYMLSLAQADVPHRWWPGVGRWVMHAIRCLPPTLVPFAKEMSNVGQSLHVSASEWGYLAAAVGYALLASTFMFLLSAWSLRRRANA